MIGIIISLISWIFLCAFFSGAETGLYSLNPLKLKMKEQLSDKNAKRLLFLIQNQKKTIIMLLVALNIANYYAVANFTTIIALSNWSKFAILIVTTIIAAPIQLVLAEIIPKNFFRINANTVSYKSSRVLMLFFWIFYPVVVLINILSILINKITRKPPQKNTLHSKANVLNYFKSGAEDGILTLYQSEIAHNVMEFQKLPVIEVMTPWDKVYKIAETDSLNKLYQLGKETKHTRFPVLEKDGISVKGVINIHDYLLNTENCTSLTQFIRQPLTFEEEKPVSEVLVKLQQQRIPFGLVKNKFGKTTGFVSIKDLVEEVVGELTSW